MDISIVVPLFNEEGVVHELHNRLSKVLNSLDKKYEIIFIDDGSSDNTYDKILEIDDIHLKVVKLRSNYGQTLALAAGIDEATGDIIIAMDGDLQHAPEDIPKFVEKIDEGWDIVSGWRKERKDNLIMRKIPSRIANWLMKLLSGINIHDFGTTFKAYKKHVIKSVKLYGQFHRFIPVIASSKLKLKITEIPIQNIKRPVGQSNYGISRTFTVFFDLIRLKFLTTYLSRPLQIFGTLGLLSGFLGFCITCYLVYLKYFYGLGLFSHRGPLFVFSLVLMVVGLLLLMLGLLGELVVKVFYELNKDKSYLVEKIFTSKQEQ